MIRGLVEVRFANASLELSPNLTQWPFYIPTKVDLLASILQAVNHGGGFRRNFVGGFIVNDQPAGLNDAPMQVPE